jgi:translation initiation factor IF-1
MPDDEMHGIEVEGRVIEALPNALYRVEIEAPRRTQVLAHVAAPALLRVLPGDGVVVALAAFDPARGRIVRRCA